MRRAWSLGGAAVISLACAIGAAAACGGSDASSTFGGGGEDASFDTGSSLPLGNNDGALPSGDAAQSTLIVAPADTTLDVTVPGPTATRQFTATQLGSQVAASWSVDRPKVGSIDANGLFTASGQLGGVVTIAAQTASAHGATTLTVRVHATENPGNVDPGTQGQLQGGGNADAAFRWLYPYDKTVFPRGLASPTLQLAGEDATAAMVHVTSKTIDYTAFYGASSPTRIDFTANAWTMITQGAAAGDPVTIAVTKLSAKGVTGPVSEAWTIAQGSLKGTVYYNTYDSPLNDGLGAVMRVKPGQDAQILLGGCHVCHAVSADGSTLVTMGADKNPSPDAGPPGDDPYFYKLGQSYDLKSGGAKLHDQSDSYFAFGGLTPDGAMMLTCGSMSGYFPPNIPGLGDVGAPQGDRPSKLMDPRTGATITATGVDQIGHGLMPAFSPDGAKVVFNDFDKGAGHSLAVMDFDAKTHAFTNRVDVAKGGPLFLGWPYFTPDSKTVIYNTVDVGDYATWNDYRRENDHHGDLFAVDVSTQAVVALDGANGMAGTSTYLPFGPSEAHLNYEPTILPVAVGGYYWVVFTSRREYGNTINDDTPDAGAFEAHPARRKKLWVAAVDITPGAGQDPSHPAFYLPGQELGAGNMRAFWALDPCKQNGTSCDSGDECCTGFCRQSNGADGGQVLSCVPQPQGCAQEFEKCNVAADCCGAPQGYQCLNGHCAQPPVK